MIRFFYNPRKAAQAAAQLVQLNGGTMDLYALMKILYLADRKALVHRGRPITGDNMVSMPYGPVLSRILDEATAPEANRFWREYLTPRENNSIILREAAVPQIDELSKESRTRRSSRSCLQRRFKARCGRRRLR